MTPPGSPRIRLVGRVVRGPQRFLVAAARARGAPARVSELLGAAAVISILPDPLAVRGAGFQLSFAGFSG